MLVNRNCFKMVNLLTRMVRLNTLQPISRGNTYNKYVMPFEHSAYDGPGHTTATILNNESTYGLMVNAYNDIGFRLNNGILVIGPSIIFPKSVLTWNVSCLEDINEESLSLFTVLEPKLDILVLGFDCMLEFKKPFIESLQTILRSKKICFEIHSLENAISVFNFLVSENRYVAAGLLPTIATFSSPRTETETPAETVEQKAIEDK